MSVTLAPDTTGIPKIRDVMMENQLQFKNQRMIGDLAPTDIRFRTLRWAIAALQELTEKGTCHAQVLIHSGTKRKGLLVICSDMHLELPQHMGLPVRSHLRLFQWGNNQAVEEILYDLELGRLKDCLEAMVQQPLLVPGVDIQDMGLQLTDRIWKGDPQIDINVLTHGLATKSDAHLGVVRLQCDERRGKSLRFRRVYC